MKFNSTPTRIYSIDPSGKLVAEITFPVVEGNTYCINLYICGRFPGRTRHCRSFGTSRC